MKIFKKNIQKTGFLLFYKIFLTGMIPAILSISSISCSEKSTDSNSKHLYFAADAAVSTLDPAFAADLTSSQMVGELYDTLLEYDYLKRPYVLKPSMLTRMPDYDEPSLKYSFTLRNDLYFTADKCFGTNQDGSFKNRKITASDVKFSLLRIADARVHSSGYWLIRNKIKGISEFRKKSENLKGKNTDESDALYSKGISGIRIIDDTHFEIYLEKTNPRFLYGLAMPYISIIPKEAVRFYGLDFASHPVGSGPFKLSYWKRRYKLEFVRNKLYRNENFHGKILPLPDKVTVFNVDQSLTAWLMFLKGELDMSALSKDTFNAVVDKNFKLIPALREKGIKMIRVPKFQIYYIGFSFTDPLLAENLNLRKAISLAYDVSKRVKIFNNCVIPAQGPIPPGCAGYDPDFKNIYSSFNINKAKEYIKLAGFPDGIDPKTGKTLELTFDLGGNSTTDRQIAELFVEDMKKIGIKIKPVLNSWPRFLQKSAKGEMQLFRVSWIGDYPDAENFLQLFYSRNAGACNRAYFKNSEYDKMYETAAVMPDSTERTRLYKKMALYLTEKCPWIFAYYPTSFRLTHRWIKNYKPHDFCFSQWKYLDIDTKEKENSIRHFEPLSYKDFNHSRSK